MGTLSPVRILAGLSGNVGAVTQSRRSMPSASHWIA